MAEDLSAGRLGVRLARCGCAPAAARSRRGDAPIPHSRESHRVTERQPSSGGGGDQPVQPAVPSYRRISPEELQQLKAQAGATRERTKELVARYVAAQESR